MSCNCPDIDIEDYPNECPIELIPMSSVKLYPKRMTAMDNLNNYLGQWEYQEEYQIVKITKDPFTIVENFNEKTGDCNFLRCDSLDGIRTKVVGWVKIPREWQLQMKLMLGLI